MTLVRQIIGTTPWLDTPPGRYLIEWEQRQLDSLVADIFGFHAVQLGWPALQGLRTNRMPHRWLLSDRHDIGITSGLPDVTLPDPPCGMPHSAVPLSVLTDFEALPFPSQSLDLVVMPHTLEFTQDPHQTLREVERVLRPEGRVIVICFNPASLWGLRFRADLVQHYLGRERSFLPFDPESIGWLRLRDWLRLLGLQIEQGRFGCYRPPLRSAVWLERTAWMERVGQHWWPVFGAVHLIVAVKRVRGMRLLGTPWRRRLPRGQGAPVLTPQRTRPFHSQSSSTPDQT